MFLGTSFFLNTRNIQLSVFAYVVVAYFSFIMGVIYCLVEHFYGRRVEKVESKLNSEKDTILAEIRDLKGQMAAEKIEKQLKQSLKKSKSSASEKFDGKVSFKGATSHLQKIEPEDTGVENQEPDKEFTIKAVSSFSLLFWVTSSTFAIGSMLQIQFLTFATDSLLNRYGYNFEDAKNTVALLPIAAVICSPFVAAILSKTGQKPLILALDLLLGVGIYTFMRSLEVKPGWQVTLSIFMIGFFYAIFTAIIWPSMTLTVP
jgi:Na+/melibiose symporter-like transporter